MQDIVVINIFQFLLIYILLLIILAVMKKSKIHQSKLLIIASFRMTIQLVLAGYVLTYIFKNPHPLLTVIYLSSIAGFSIGRILTQNRHLNKKFKITIAFSQGITGLSILLFFVFLVIGESIFNPQYMIPLGGMIMGNSMNGVTLGLKTFQENLSSEKEQMQTLLNIGADPKVILLPFVNRSIETALLPTLNSMLGMGIISLPGMMTGQILSGTLPTTAILYQISIMICIATVVCVSVFCSLFLGYRTLYNKKNQFIL